MKTELKVWRVIIPTLMNDKPVRTRHHRVWDAYVREITGGLSILAPGKGQWINSAKELVEERIIPVDIVCTNEQFEKIKDYSFKHYQQDAMMFFLVSDTVFIEDNPYKK
jgi:hypothetical protein